MQLTDEDLAVLAEARATLENPSIVIRLSSAFGMPVEAVTRELGRRAPKALAEAVSTSSRKAVDAALKAAAWSLKSDEPLPASTRLHTVAAATSGAVGGFFGMQGLVVELPVTTGIMFRSMADIARAEGESPREAETLINVVQVFALGSGASSQDDAAETSYYGARLALGKVVTEAMQYVARHGAGNAAAPALVRLTTAIAARFGIVVTQKAMAQAIPVVGAVGGGLVNTVFISHFQDMARAHFSIRRLERKYSPEFVQDAYTAMAATAANAECRTSRGELE
ncbi:MAG: EcsC family protein [Woeseiaceae bacterium]|jgi:hypothetical protein|nr:EcsC family protein [Woeseiaceae bacterium]